MSKTSSSSEPEIFVDRTLPNVLPNVEQVWYRADSSD